MVPRQGRGIVRRRPAPAVRPHRGKDINAIRRAEAPRARRPIFARVHIAPPRRPIRRLLRSPPPQEEEEDSSESENVSVSATDSELELPEDVQMEELNTSEDEAVEAAYFLEGDLAISDQE